MRKPIFLGLICCGLWGYPSLTGADGFIVERLVGGLDHPLYVTQAPGDNRTLYILEQRAPATVGGLAVGRIRKFDLQLHTLSAWAEVPGLMPDLEGGLHCLAFHPDYSNNKKLYLADIIPNPTGSSVSWASQLAEYVIDPNGNPQFSRELIVLPERNDGHSWHMMGWIGFQPNASNAERNYLYVTLGDGGYQAADPQFVNVSQDLSVLWGKLIRIDVDGPDYYPGDPFKNFGVPRENPYFEDGDNDNVDDDPATLPEIFHSGLRNPWRASFDQESNDLYIGNVGFQSREEIEFARYNQAGIDFGWARREGTIATPVAGVGGPLDDSQDPIFETTHAAGDYSITGGYVYRGPVEELQGLYFFADYVSNRIWSGRFDPNTDPSVFDGDNLTELTERRSELQDKVSGGATIEHVSSFGEDHVGHLYLVDMGTGSGLITNFGTGEVFRVVPTPPYCNVRPLSDLNMDCRVSLGDLPQTEPSLSAVLAVALEWLECGLFPSGACP